MIKVNVKQVQSSEEFSSCGILLLFIEELYIMGLAAYDSIAVNPLGVLEDGKGKDLTAA